MYPYLILDARYEKVRLDGVIQSQAVFIALGINEEGRRQVLGVELSNRESRSSWTAFVTGLKTRGQPGSWPQRTNGRLAWRTLSFATNRSSETVCEPGRQAGGRLRRCSRATS